MVGLPNLLGLKGLFHKIGEIIFVFPKRFKAVEEFVGVISICGGLLAWNIGVVVIKPTTKMTIVFAGQGRFVRFVFKFLFKLDQTLSCVLVFPFENSFHLKIASRFEVETHQAHFSGISSGLSDGLAMLVPIGWPRMN